MPDQEFFDALVAHLGWGKSGRTLFRVSLTLPSFSGSRTHRRHARRFAAWAAGQGRKAGAWLVLDLSKKGRHHWYGVVLANTTKHKLRSQWQLLTGVVGEAQDVKLVTGQAKPWIAANPVLLSNLRTVIGYSCKPLLMFAAYTGTRVVASGAMVALWKTASRAHKAATKPRAHLNCLYCSASLIGRRAHAKYCSKSCRASAWRRGQTRSAPQPTPTAVAPVPEPTCRHCGTSTADKRRDAMYCSGRCRTAAARARNICRQSIADRVKLALYEHSRVAALGVFPVHSILREDTRLT